MRDEFPLPDLTEPLTGPFWEHAQRGVLAIPKTPDRKAVPTIAATSMAIVAGSMSTLQHSFAP